MPYPIKPTIFPHPKRISWGGNFLDWQNAEFDISPNGLPHGKSVFVENSAKMENEQSYVLKICDGAIRIKSRSDTGVRLAAQTLRQIAAQSDERGLRHVEIDDYPDLPVRGFMLDISRCKVPTMEELSLLVDRLSLFKYNRLELYTEHTYAFRGHELVWADASPMTAAQYAKLDKMCSAAGIELVPNMNGLGHMERWLRYPKYQYLAESKAPFIDPLGTVREFPTTLYPDENALEFMDSLYGQFLPNFTSSSMNIGGDEPWELGMGRSKSACENLEYGKYSLYLKHILGLRDLCKKRGKDVCFWADVIMQKPELAKELPPDMCAIIWGYYLDHPYDEQCSLLSKLGIKFFTAPGTSTWNSFGSRWDCAFENIKTAAACAKKYGARGMILTQWGDGGNHQPWCAMYPAMACAAACAWGSAPGEDAICSAIDKLVFFDDTGEFSRALCALGRVDPSLKLKSFHHEVFFAPGEKVGQIIDAHSNPRIGELEAALDFAASLAGESSPRSKDARACLSEFALAVEMTKFALAKAKGDFYTETLKQQVALKFIASEYERVWLARARLGGMRESAQRIRSVRPDIFL